MMDTTRHEMLLIKSLDPDACLLLSGCTHGWYVDADIMVSNGTIIGGVTEHRDTPEEAVAAFLDHLKNLSLDFVIVTDSGKFGGGERRRHWRWNGAAFREEHDNTIKVPA